MECSDCGQPGATLKRIDAADEEHWYHDECWENVAAWLAGHDGPRDRKCARALCRRCRNP